MALAAAIRLIGVGSTGLTFDELFTVQIVARSRDLLQLVSSVATQDAHPPLYYVLTWLWLHIVGFGDTAAYRPGIELALRLPWALTGVVSVAIIIGLGRKLFGPGVGILSGLLLTLEPLVAGSDRIGRMYPLLVFLGLVSWTLLVRARERKELRPWLGYALAASLMLYTHYLAVFVLLGQAVYVVVASPRRRRGILALAIAAASFVPWVPTLLTSILQGRANTYLREPIDVVVRHLLGWIAATGSTPAYFGAATVLAWVLILLGAIVAWGTRDHRRWFFVSSAVVPLGAWLGLSATWLNVAGTRYLMIFVPYLLILLAVGIATLASRYRFVFLATVCVVVASFAFGGAEVVLLPQHADWKAARTAFKVHVEAGDVVLTNSRLTSALFAYYLVSDRAPSIPIITVHDPRRFPLDQLLGAKHIWVATEAFGAWDPRNWTIAEGDYFTQWYQTHTVTDDARTVGTATSVLVLSPNARTKKE